MAMQLNVPIVLNPGTVPPFYLSGEYLYTNNANGVFIDIDPRTRDGSTNHCGIAFFCNEKPPAGWDASVVDLNNVWLGQARGVIFQGDGKILWEDWKGGQPTPEDPRFATGYLGEWESNRIYRVTSTWMGDKVITAVYKTDNNGNVISLIGNRESPTYWSGGIPPQMDKGDHACVFTIGGFACGACAIALYY